MTKPKSKGRDLRWYAQQHKKLINRLADAAKDRDTYRKRAEAADKAIEVTANMLNKHAAFVRSIFEERALAAEEVVDAVRCMWHSPECSSDDKKVLGIQEHLCDCWNSVICKALVKYNKTNEHWHEATAGGKARCIDLNCSAKRV